jgi:glycine dehydrogenase
MKLNFEKERFDIRHIGPDAKEVSEMLKAIGVTSVDELIDQTIPKKIRSQKPLNLDEPLTEHEYLDKIERIGKKNKIFRNYIGMGYYNCFTPSVILRNVMENPGWYTPYTPYQSEIAQGRLEGLLNFQTMVMDLTGMPIANSSLLDEATAAAEAMAMLYSKKKNKTATKFFVSDKTYNQTADVLKTRAEHFGIEIVLGDLQTFVPTDEYFAALVQYPDANGEVKNFKKLRADLDKVGAYLIVAADLMSLVLLTPPSEFGADVVVGTTQRFGIPLGFGGPHAAYFATKDEFKRIIPGRIIGVSLDSNGNPALRMALQTREQHIRRDKATSNICTAQALLANMAAFYAIYHGSVGLKRIATRIHSFASLVNDAVTGFGYTQLNQVYFDTIKFDLKGAGVSVKELRKVAEKHEINLCYFKDGTVGAS